MGTFGGPVLQRVTDTYGEWVKIFRHRSTDNVFFADSNDWEEAKQINTGFPNADKYSILEGWGHFLRNDKYTLKLTYPSQSIENPSFVNKTNIWSQTNNPVTTTATHAGVTGYTAIDIDAAGSAWGGLERSSTNTFLDGSTGTSTWWYAIGSANNYDTSNPNFPGPGQTTQLVELWILDKPA